MKTLSSVDDLIVGHKYLITDVHDDSPIFVEGHLYKFIEHLTRRKYEHIGRVNDEDYIFDNHFKFKLPTGTYKLRFRTVVDAIERYTFICYDELTEEEKFYLKLSGKVINEIS